MKHTDCKGLRYAAASYSGTEAMFLSSDKFFNV